jgi:hypothetical protein
VSIICYVLYSFISTLLFWLSVRALASGVPRTRLLRLEVIPIALLLDYLKTECRALDNAGQSRAGIPKARAGGSRSSETLKVPAMARTLLDSEMLERM